MTPESSEMAEVLKDTLAYIHPGMRKSVGELYASMRRDDAAERAIVLMLLKVTVGSMSGAC